MSDDKNPLLSGARELHERKVRKKKEALQRRLRASSIPEGCGDDDYAADQAVQRHVDRLREALCHDLSIKPSYELWGKLHVWTVAQAILLLSDLDPDSIDLGRIYLDLNMITEAMGEEQFVRLDETYRMLIDEYLHKRHGSELAHLENRTFVEAYTDEPSAFLKWAHDNVTPVPEKLMAIVHNKSQNNVEVKKELADPPALAPTSSHELSELSDDQRSIILNGQQVNKSKNKNSISDDESFKVVLHLLSFWDQAKRSLEKERPYEKRSNSDIANRLARLHKNDGRKDHRDMYPGGPWLHSQYKQVKTANPDKDFLFMRR